MDAVTQVFGVVVPTIERRLELLPEFFSEDNFRYLVVNEFRKDGVDVARIAPEYPLDVHAKGVRRKIDTVILDANGKPKTAIEFKCIRNPGAISEDAGDLLGDFARLRDFDFPYGEGDRFVAPLTDGELWGYLNNPNKKINWILCESEQEISDGKIPRGPGFKALRKYAGK